MSPSRAGNSPGLAIEGVMAEVDWAIEASRAGEPTLMLARRHVHSQYDPLRESLRLAEQVLQTARDGRNDSLVIIGSGLGYVTREVIRRFEGRVLLWEPFPELRRELDACVAELTDGDPKPARAPTVATSTREFDDALGALGARPSFWIHPGYEHICRFEARYALRAMRRRAPHRGRVAKRDAVVSERGLDAVGRLPTTPAIDDLGDCLRGHTAIIASGGPSLRPALASLARHAGGARFVCIQMLGVVAEARAHANFAVSVDLRNLFTRFGLENDVPYDLLLADSSSDPNMLEAHRSRLCLFHQRTAHIHQLLWQALDLDVIDEPSISVSETALVLAHRMGARRFVLAGVDLDSDDPRYKERFLAADGHGSFTGTNSHYFHAARYLGDYCSRLRDEGCDVLRLGDGLPIAGCEPIGLDAFDSLVAELPRFETPELSSEPNAERLAASRRLYRDVARGAMTNSATRRHDPGIARNDAGWKPLDARTSRNLARKELRLLDERSAGSLPAI